MGTSQSKPRRYKRPYNRVPPPSALDKVPDGDKIEHISHAQPCFDDEFYDVVGADAGNLTVFSWITQATTCCASVCTLIILMVFVIWFIINDGGNN